MAKKNKEEQYKPQKMQQSVYSKAFDVFNIVFMILFCITILIPFWDMIVRSFSRAQDISFMHVNFFPKVWSFEAYAYCFKDSEILNAMLISVARTVLGTAFHIVVTCLAAYTLTRDQMPYRRLITGILLIPMFFSGGLIPTYINMRPDPEAFRFTTVSSSATISSPSTRGWRRRPTLTALPRCRCSSASSCRFPSQCWRRSPCGRLWASGTPGSTI